MNMVSDYIAFLLKALAVSFAYQMRDAEPSLVDLKKSTDDILKTFEAFKAKNDERLKQLEEKGAADPITTEQVDKINAELDSLKDVRDKLDKLSKRAARPGGDGKEGENFTADQIEHRNAFNAYLRKPNDEQTKLDLQQIEKKAVQTTTDNAGGYAVPEIISRRIERDLAEISPLRQLVDVQTAGSKDFKILVDTRGLTYGWVGETNTRAETDTPGLAEVAPTFGTIYAYPKATEESLDDMFFNVEGWLATSIIEGFAEGEENAIVNGNGTNKPTGFLNGTPVATADGARAFGVLQFIASGAAGGFAATDPGDAFLSTIYALKKGYRRNARWLMNKATAGEIRKFKDGDGNYLWQPTTVAGQPDKLMGFAVAETEEMPDVSANAFPIAFGDFNAGYVLADLVGFRLTRDDITQPGYIKWYARRRLGGKVKKSEAIKLLKIAA